jgi:hypothetical protein
MVMDTPDYEIFFYNGTSTTRLTNNSYHDLYPQISGNNVVWSGYDGTDYEIYFYNGTSTTQLTNNSYGDYSPQISGSNVVWTGYDGTDDEIFFYNGTSTTQLTNNSYYDHSPQISGNNVVWSGYDGTDYEIFFYNGTSTTQLTNNSYSYGDYSPQISGNNVVWNGYPGTGPNRTGYEIYFYNGTSTTQLTNTNSHGSSFPQISGNNVVWDGYDGTDTEIYQINLGPKILPTITVAATDANAGETVSGATPNPGVFTLTRTESNINPLTVNYTITGTAANGTDYLQLTGTATFAAGSTTSTINVTPTDDFIFEGNETVVLTLATGTGYTLGTAKTATVTIADNDAIPQLSINDVTITEGNSGTKNANFAVKLSNPSTQTITVAYQTANVTATAGSDYIAQNGTITFNPGDISKIVSIVVNGDTAVETNETFTVNLSNPSNGAIITTGTALGTITNDDFALELNVKGTTNNYLITSYDPNQDITGTVNTSADNKQVELQGNTWKKLDIGNYTITNNTLLKFEYQSTKLGEIQGIGFDTNNSFITANDGPNLFQLAGTQNVGLSAFKNYSIGSGWKSYSINVGDYLSGSFNYLTLANDHDVANPNSNSVFRNIALYESGVAVNVKGTTSNYTPTSYDPNQDITGTVNTSADNKQVELQGNTWKKLDIGNYTITNNTLLKFEYQSTKLGEIQGIGFDTNNSFITANDGPNLFQLAGTQNVGLSAFKNYSIGSGWKSYSINVGDYLSGSFNYLTLANDHDVANPNSNSVFRNIALYESGVAVNVKGTTSNYTPTSYDPNQDITGTVNTSADNKQVELQGNTWKKLDIGNYTITNNTLLKFEYQSTKLGEIQGIGFDTNNSFITANDGPNLFQLAGTQNVGLSAFKNYSIGSGWKSYSINVGDYLSGTFNYLTLANDHDVANPNSNSVFRNIALYESI